MLGKERGQDNNANTQGERWIDRERPTDLSVKDQGGVLILWPTETGEEPGEEREDGKGEETGDRSGRDRAGNRGEEGQRGDGERGPLKDNHCLST